MYGFIVSLAFSLLTVLAPSGDSTGKKSIRLLYWNIQNGMWSDQANGYDNFVEFVRQFDPDICVWCEASSIYKDNSNTHEADSCRYLPGGWPELALRYGHKYSALGGKRDNYPQEVTSKYPIETLLRITDTDIPGKPVSHGAAIQQVNVNGRKLNFITCHMWPQAYGFGIPKDKRKESADAHEGDYYRQFEMRYILSHTIGSEEFASLQDWILLGDMNSRSRQDNWYMKYPENDTRLLTQDEVLANSRLLDSVYEFCREPKRFYSTTYGMARIDFVYLSASLMEKVVNIRVPAETWSVQNPSPYVPSFIDPSDHRPIIIDFEF